MVTVEEEFKRNPELKQIDIDQLKDWVSKQPHLPKDIPDSLLVLMLHSCYYSLEQSKQTVDNFFTLRTHLPELFNDRDITSPPLQQAFNIVNIILLERRTPAGLRVLYGGFKNNDSSLFDFVNIMKILFMTCDVAYQKDGSTPGDIIVIDFNGMKLSHLAKITIPMMKKVLTVLQDAAPVRLKGLHFINIVSFIDKVVAMMKPFMRKELIEILELHSVGSESIYSVVPKELFPVEFGGLGGSLQDNRERNLNGLKEFRVWFEKDEEMRVDENKRPGKAKSAGELFGVDGTFRKLNID